VPFANTDFRRGPVDRAASTAYARARVIRLAFVALAALYGYAAAAPAPSRAPAFGILEIRLHRLPATGTYIEGAAWHVRVTGNFYGSSARLFDAQTLTENHFSLRRVSPGTYTVTSFMRPCDGNCSLLDPPVDRCSGPVRVSSRATARVVVDLRAPGRGCRIRVAR
jgi:hypothetical protein